MVCETHHFHIPRNTAMTTGTKRKTAAVELKALLGEDGDGNCPPGIQTGRSRGLAGDVGRSQECLFTMSRSMRSAPVWMACFALCASRRCRLPAQFARSGVGGGGRGFIHGIANSK